MQKFYLQFIFKKGQFWDSWYQLFIQETDLRRNLSAKDTYSSSDESAGLVEVGGSTLGYIICYTTIKRHKIKLIQF